MLIKNRTYSFDFTVKSVELYCITLLHSWNRTLTTTLVFIYLQKTVVFFSSISTKQLYLQSLTTLTFEDNFSVQAKYMESIQLHICIKLTCMGTLGLFQTPLCSYCTTLPTKYFGAYGYGMETGEGEGNKMDHKVAFWQEIIRKNWQDQQLC